MHLSKARFVSLAILMFLSFLLFSPNNLYALDLVAPNDYSKDNLSIGSEYYLDRTYTITSQPSGFQDYTAILTKNNDKYVSDDQHIIFNIAQDATVYVAYDSRASSLPTWMQSFTSTGSSVGTTDVTLNLYEKDFSAGQVVLGGNHNGGDTGANSNYFVYVAENIVLVVDPTTLTVPFGGTATAAVSGGVSPYDVSSNNPSVATASVNGNTVTVTGEGEGSTTINVTDNDSPSQSATISVEVTIVPIAVNPDTMSIDVGGIGSATVGDRSTEH
jgi:hypothetical protein